MHTDVSGVLVVIPTLNEATHIQAVLGGLVKEAPSFSSMRIVVADGGSTDGTIAIVNQVAQRHPQIALLHNPARIQSAAINLAARRYGQGADVLIRCDAHAAYPANYCRRLVESLDRTAALGGAMADAVVVPMDSAGKTCFQRAVAWVSNSPLGTGGAAHRAGRRSGFVDHGHHAAFRMDRFRASGGYDETFTHNEDAEFDCRQRALGARIYLDASIRVQYRPRGSARGLWRQYFAYGGGRSRTVRRYPGSLRLRQLAVPSHLVLSALALLVSPWWAWSLAWPAFYLLTLLGMSALLAVRHRSACGLLAGPAAAIMHTSWACGFLLGLITRRERRWRPTMVTPLGTGAAEVGS
ncbi:MAG TPA: glycosyltransferase family 2 protein [Polyangia bacterium]|nr:glycosyltransferase family 2 protein [Polyangia bacterium]